MKAIGHWVILKTQEEVSGSGIVSINDNICLVVDCYSLEGPQLGLLSERPYQYQYQVPQLSMEAPSWVVEGLSDLRAWPSVVGP